MIIQGRSEPFKYPMYNLFINGISVLNTPSMITIGNNHQQAIDFMTKKIRDVINELNNDLLFLEQCKNAAESGEEPSMSNGHMYSVDGYFPSLGIPAPVITDRNKTIFDCF